MRQKVLQVRPAVLPKLRTPVLRNPFGTYGDPMLRLQLCAPTMTENSSQAATDRTAQHLCLAAGSGSGALWA